MNKQREPVQLDIKVQISAEAIQKIRIWTDIAKGEVSALGLVDEIRDEDSGAVETLRVTDVFLVKQICNDCETELDSEAVAQLMLELETAGIDTGKLKAWAHSHGTMQVFLSGQDDETIEGLSNGEWLLSLVVNKFLQSLMRLDQFHPTHMYIGDVVWEVHYPAIEGLEEQCRKEFKEKVKEGYYVTKTYKSTRSQQLRIMPDTFDEDLYWEGVEEDDLEEIQSF